MFVNTNVSALQAVLNLQNTTNSMDNVLQQLSSGLSINSAADNPAGLAISQQMQTQIDGLNQAQQNTQNGISLLQTADGALSNVDTILQSMRSLASQAATGTNNAIDLQALQSEMNQYAQEITSITNTTQFNTLNLLSGAFGGAVGGSYNASGVYVGGTQTSLQYIQIGANAGQELAIGINPLDAVSLGVAGITSTVQSDTANTGISVAALGTGLNAGTWTVQMSTTQATFTTSLAGATVTGGTFDGNANVTYTVTTVQPSSGAAITLDTGALNTLNLSTMTAGSLLASGYYTLVASITNASVSYSDASVTSGTAALALSVTDHGSGTVTYSLGVTSNGTTWYYTLQETSGGSTFVGTVTASAATTSVSFTDTANGVTITATNALPIPSTTGSYAITVTAATGTFQLKNSVSGSVIGTTNALNYNALAATTITVGDVQTGQVVQFNLAGTTFLTNLAAADNTSATLTTTTLVASLDHIGSSLTAGSWTVNGTYTAATISFSSASAGTGATALTVAVNDRGNTNVTYTLTVATNLSGTYVYTLKESSGGATTTITQTFSAATTVVTFTDAANGATITVSSTTAVGTVTGNYTLTTTAAQAQFQLDNPSSTAVGGTVTVTGYSALSAEITAGTTTGGDQTVGFQLSSGVLTALATGTPALTAGTFTVNVATGSTASASGFTDFTAVASGNYSYSVTGSDGYSTTIAGTTGGLTVLSLTDGGQTITVQSSTAFTSGAFQVTAVAASATFELLNGAGSQVGSSLTAVGYASLTASLTVGDTSASDATAGQFVTFSLGTASGSLLSDLFNTAATSVPTSAAATLAVAYAGSAAVTTGNGVVTTDATVTSGLGIQNQSSAAAALNIIDKAITVVDQQRANIGAYQNRLQFASSNASTGSVNLSSAQAGIMDTNMALQMANLSKYQVLQQSGMAMLLNADQIPQALLKVIG